MNISDEVIFDILLNSNIHDIKNLCQTDNQFNRLCHDKHFWIIKFNQDQLPFTDGPNYIDVYINAMVNKLVFYIKNQPFQYIHFTIPLTILIEIDPKTFSLVKEDFNEKIEEFIGIAYNQYNNTWTIDTYGNRTRVINEDLVISYLQYIIYHGGNIYLNKIGISTHYLNFI